MQLRLVLYDCVIYDFVYYWMQRTQRALPVVGAAQHAPELAPDELPDNDRGNLTMVYPSMVLAVVGLAIGVQPDEFAWRMLLGERAQNFSAYQ